MTSPLPGEDHLQDGALDPPAAISGQELQRLAMSGSMWTALHAVTSIPIAFVANAVIARSLGVTDYGSLAFLTIAFAIATQVGNLGFSESLVRNGAESEARGDQAATDGLLRRSAGFHLLVQLPIVWCAALLLSRGESWVVVAALLASSAITCSLGGAVLFLTLSNRGASAAKIGMMSNLAVQVATAAVALVYPDPIAVIAARLLAGAVGVPLFLLAVPANRRRAALAPLLPRGMPPGFWKFAAQSFLAGLLTMLVFSRSEIVLLSWLGSAEAAGLFALAFGLSYQITAPVDAMLNPMMPAVTGLVAARPDLAQRAFLRASRFSSLLCALITSVALPLIFFAVPLVYGDEFEPAARLLLPLALVSCIQSMGQTATAFVFARAQGGRLVNANLMALAVNVGTAIPLILAIGVWGAVVSNVLGQLVSVGFLLRGELRTQGIGWRTYLGTIAVWPLSVVTGAIAVVLATGLRQVEDSGLVAAAASALVGFGLIAVAARATGVGLDPGDRDAMLDALPRRVRRAAAPLCAVFVSQLRSEVGRADKYQEGR